MKSDFDALMEARDFAAVLVFGSAEHNPPMYYFTGGGHISAATLLKKRGEPPVLYYNDMEREEAARTGLRTRSFSEYPLQELQKEAGGDMGLAVALRLDRILKDHGIRSGRVGVYGHTEVSGVLALAEHLRRLAPDVALIGESGMDSIFIRAMETKEPEEVERIRKMGALTAEVVRLTAEYLTACQVRDDEVLLKADGSPLTVGDVKARIRLWVAERGAELPAGFIFAIGRDAGVPHSAGTAEDLVRLGQTIIYDIYPAESGGGYFYDFTRTWSLGYATPRAQELYDQVKQLYDRLADEFDLNAPFRSYQVMACEYFESRGHRSLLNTQAPLDGYVHSLGHGVGLNIHERPFSGLPVGEDHRLAPGVVITSEPGLYYPDEGMGVRIEDTVWVRPDGVMEILADYPYDFVLPMKNWNNRNSQIVNRKSTHDQS